MVARGIVSGEVVEIGVVKRVWSEYVEGYVRGYVTSLATSA